MTEVSESKPSRSKASRKITRSFVQVTVLFCLILIGYVAIAVVNDHRKGDIKTARIEACRQSYDGMHKVFLPLFTDPPQTPRRAHRVKVFNDGIIKLKQQCLELSIP